MSVPVAAPVHASPLETSQVQLPWVPSTERLALAHIGAISRSPHRTDAYEVECAFVQIDRQSHTPLIGVAPLEQLGLLRPGSIFENQRYIGRLDTLRTRRVGGLKLKDMSQFNKIGRFEYIQENRFAPGSREMDLSPIAQRWVNNCRHEGLTYYVPSGEIFRFYFGALSLGAASFMSLASSDQDGVGLVDPEHTRFLEPDVLQIAPTSGLADRSSALQLALLLHSPELMAIWRTTVDRFIADHAWGSEQFYPPIELPVSRHPFVLHGLGAKVQHRVPDGSYERGFMTWAIISDYRPVPFRRLIIKLPYGMSEVDLDQPDEAEDNAPTRYANLLPSDLKLESRRRPGVAAGRMSHYLESLQRAFPRLASVQVDYEAPRAPRLSSKRRVPASPEERVVEELSALLPGHDRRVGGVVLRPGAIYRPEAPTQTPTQRLFDDTELELGEFVPAVAEQARYPFPTFISAFNLLMRHQAGGLVGQNPISSFGGDVMVLKPPASWGSAARGRAIAVGRVDLHSGHVYAFELSRRRADERISLGLVAKLDGSAMSWFEISAVARHAVAQITLRSTGSTSKSPGVWPSPSEFTDVLGRSVKHTRRRRTPAWLAEDLDALGRSLFTPDKVRAAA